MRWRTIVVTDATVSRLVGHGRLEAVELLRADGATGRLDCDTVVFTGDWVPDGELARSGGLDLDPGTHGPAVDGLLRTSATGVFAVGNLVHPVETADVAAVRAARTAWAVRDYLAEPRGEVPESVAVVAEAPLAWVWPNLWRPDVGREAVGPHTIWSTAFVERPRLRVRQDDRVLLERRLHRTVVPNRPYALPAGWTTDVDPDGGVVRVSVEGA